jgi:crossover junction endodeoxyribonuclease RusA
LILPIPPSINHQYATVHGRRILSAAGRRYKDEVGRRLLLAMARCSCRESLLSVLRSNYLALTIRFHFTAPLRRDVDGGLKITQDAVAEALGINDNRIVELHVFKNPRRTDPCVEVSLQVSAWAQRDLF